ncbi:anaerobic carbon-monoxide dehydrogenase catalytic subunit [Sporomusa sp.]|uniref:anaerobic carbon-monoxide dehydrogenase catalytic subunit n=1 Tax=Sporomusa sp. TaxID=2078658 RepID=UPI002BCE1017|nr:anaerobic carbon-monoxide dehydrogenase catalytic subunit [Sporomusa sp.]HWR06474.1 anaerobic carbon-monoxide dehydrogenase catalytic subunit [Sporomusa sp.]
MSFDAINEYRKTFPSKQQVIEQTPDPGVRAMLNHLDKAGIPTAFDRFDAQKPHCSFGLAGTCCRICNMGPCRITEKSPKGVCGADAHVMVARNILRWVAAGVAAHGARGREVLLTLKKAASGELALPLLGPEKVLATAKAFGIYQEDKTVAELAEQLADLLLEDMSRAVPATHRTITAMAPPERVETWSKLDIIPISSYHEVFEALHRTGTGTDGDWENLMKQLLRCGLAFSWNSVVGPSIAADCLYGPPKRSQIETNFASIKEEYVNIALHGHSPVLPSALVQASRDQELVDLAKAAGAAGIRLYGICCSGLSSLYRYGEVHPLSNSLGAELIMGTGALDAWVADLQDIYPAIMDVAACFHTKVITTSDSCRLPGAIHMAFDHQHSNMDQILDQAKDIVRLAIRNYPARQKENVYIPEVSIEAEVGFSVENITQAFGSLDELAALIKSGKIKGIVNLVGCNNPKVVYEQAILQVADILLANDIIVLTNGCASFPLLKLGYCSQKALAKAGPGLNEVLGAQKLPPVWHMGECLDNARASGLFRALADKSGQPLTRMPVAFASPEWSNEKGVGAALSFRLMGLNSYHCIQAPVQGSDKVANFFGKDTQDLLGSVMVVVTDPQGLGQKIVEDLEHRRNQLGWDGQ